MYSSRLSFTRPIVLAVIAAASSAAVLAQAPSPTASPPGSGSEQPAAPRAPATGQPPSPADVRARIVELRARRQAAPKDPDPAYQLGVFYLDWGDPANAEDQLRQAIELGSTRTDAWPLLARAWLLRGKYVEIQAEIPVDALTGSAQRAAVAVVQGLAWLAKDRPDEARRRFQEALVLEPDYSPAYVGLARVAIAQENMAAAKDAATSAAAGRAPDAAEVAALRGDLAAADKDFAVAEAAYQQAVNANPNHVWRLLPLAQVQIAQKKLDEADANLARLRDYVKADQVTLYLQGLSALLRGDYQRASDTVAPILGAQVGEPRALLVAGTAAYQQGQYQQAREFLQRFLKHQPDDPDALRLMGATLVRLGEPKEALTYALPLVKAPNPGIETLLLAGSASVLAGDPKAGVGYLERAQALRPDDKDLRRFIATAKIGIGDDEAGERELEKLLADGAEGLEDLELGLLQRGVRVGAYDKVLRAAGRFQQRHPNQPEGWLYQGIAQVRLGDPTAARPAFERALSLSPRNLDALIGLAEVQLVAGNPQGAADAIVAALEVSPGNPLLLDNLSAVAPASGDTERAIKTIKPLLAADPDNVVLAAALARAYTAAGQPLAALEFLASRGDAQDPRLLREKGLGERRAGRLAAALATFRGAADAAPGSIRAQLDLARATQEAGDAVAAGKLWDKAATLDPANDEARIGQAGAALLGLSAPLTADKLKPVLSQVAETLKNYPDAPGAPELEATLLIATNQPQVAAERMARVYADTRGSVDVLLLSRAYLYAKDKARALAVLRDHVGQFPGDIQVRMDLAHRYLADGQVEPSVEQLSAIVARDWGNTQAQVELAYILTKSGRADDAAPHLRAAAQALPNDQRVKEMLKSSRRSPPVKDH